MELLNIANCVYDKKLVSKRMPSLNFMTAHPRIVTFRDINVFTKYKFQYSNKIVRANLECQFEWEGRIHELYEMHNL